MSEVYIDRLLVIGVGLIGGSFAIALRNAGVVGEIVGAGRSQENLERGVELGVIDRYVLDFSNEVGKSDVIFVSTPVLSTDFIFQKISLADYHGSVITDAGSVKGSIIQSAERHFDWGFQGFVAAHPIAGRENSGVTAATGDLYEGKRTIITPSRQSGEEATDLIRNLWLAAGSVVTEMNADTHDQLVSASSHLPHLVAFGLVNYIANHSRSAECFDLAASGFYDFTRIASSDPIMWRDISLLNSESIVRELMGYIDRLEILTSQIAQGDGAAIEDFMKVAKISRDHHLRKRSQ